MVIALFSVAVAQRALHSTETEYQAPWGMSAAAYNPSAMMAAGKSFTIPHGISDRFPEGIPRDSPYGRFLELETDTVSREEVPVPHPVHEISGPTRLHQHLFVLIGVFWWFFGISWSNLTWLLAAFHAATAAVVYGLYRQCMGRVLSLAGALLYAVGGAALYSVSSFRDYSKAMFILAAVLVFVRLLRLGAKRQTLIESGALLGIILGIGIGFRYDIMVLLPPALFLLAAAPSAHHAYHWKSRLAAMLLMGALFFACALPVLTAETERGTHDHIMGGLAPGLSERLGIGGADYQLIAENDDMLTWALVNHLAIETEGGTEAIRFIGEEAAAPGRRLLFELFTTFPGDLYLRGLAAFRTIAETTPITSAPFDAEPTRTLTRWAAPVTAHLSQWGLVYLGAALLALGTLRLHTALTALILIVYLCAYTSLQFFERHYFHLTVLLPLALGFLVSGIPRTRGIARVPLRSAANAGVFVLVAAAVLLGPLYLGRVWQDARVTDLWQRLSEATLRPIETETLPLPENMPFRHAFEKPVFVRVVHPTDVEAIPVGFDTPRIHTRYLVAEFAPAAVARRIGLVYSDPNWPPRGFTRLAQVQPTEQRAGGIVRRFFSVDEFPNRWSLYHGPNTFSGLVMERSDLEGFQGLYEVAEPGAFPIRVDTTLPEDIAGLPTHKRYVGRD